MTPTMREWLDELHDLDLGIVCDFIGQPIFGWDTDPGPWVAELIVRLNETLGQMTPTPGGGSPWGPILRAAREVSLHLRNGSNFSHLVLPAAGRGQRARKALSRDPCQGSVTS